MYTKRKKSQSSRYPNRTIINTALTKLSSNVNIAAAQSPAQRARNGVSNQLTQFILLVFDLDASESNNARSPTSSFSSARLYLACCSSENMSMTDLLSHFEVFLSPLLDKAAVGRVELAIIFSALHSSSTFKRLVLTCSIERSFLLYFFSLITLRR